MEDGRMNILVWWLKEHVYILLSIALVLRGDEADGGSEGQDGGSETHIDGFDGRGIYTVVQRFELNKI
jgi:hypothetical protein